MHTFPDDYKRLAFQIHSQKCRVFKSISIVPSSVFQNCTSSTANRVLVCVTGRFVSSNPNTVRCKAKVRPLSKTLNNHLLGCVLRSLKSASYKSSSAKRINVSKYFRRPEHQLLSASYTELTEQLNSQLSEKADTQITLNETRNEIQSTKEKIARVHSTRKDLQDNLIRERKQFEETKKMLEKEVLKRVF